MYLFHIAFWIPGEESEMARGERREGKLTVSSRRPVSPDFGEVHAVALDSGEVGISHGDL